MTETHLLPRFVASTCRFFGPLLLLMLVQGVQGQQFSGCYKIESVGTGKTWCVDRNGFVSTETPQPRNSWFALIPQTDGSFQIRNTGTGKLLHVNTFGDKFLSTRWEPNDDHTKFYVRKQSDGTFRINVKADGRFLHSDGPGGAIGEFVSTRWQPDDAYTRFRFVRPIGVSQWMASLSGSTRINALTIPGTHDSGAQIGSEFVRCQTLNIRQQLDSGIRFLDMRFKVVSRNGIAMDVYHGFVDMGLKSEDVFNAVEEFLTANPTECVLMHVREEETSDVTGETPLTVLNQMAESRPDLFWRSTETTFERHSTNCPMLDDVRGKIVLVANSNLSAFGNRSKSESWRNWLSYPEEENIDGGDYWLVRGIGATGIPKYVDTKWRRMTRVLPNDALRWVGISGTGVGTENGLFPSTVASYLNTAISEKLKADVVRRYGIVAMDYPPVVLTNQLIASNFAGLATDHAVYPSMLKRGTRLADGDEIELKVTQLPASLDYQNSAIIKIELVGNVDWWKSIRVINPSTGRQIAEISVEGRNAQKELAIPLDQLRGCRLFLCKAKPRYTEIYQMLDTGNFQGQKRYTFSWQADR